MKKLLLSSIVLLLFSCSILIFEVSCQKEAKADTNYITQQNKIVYLKEFPIENGQDEIWTANIDGTNQKRYSINFPANYELDAENGNITLTPDNQKIIFALDVNRVAGIYSCNIDGSNLVKII
ncbi:MAG: hypothetical protein IPP53_08940 [Bacteroidetes bacterium]|nr:hypothetical protein [Bacteroidota bacterium]